MTKFTNTVRNITQIDGKLGLFRVFQKHIHAYKMLTKRVSKI